MLGFYGNGQMSGVVNMPVKGRIEHVLTHISKVHPQIRAEYETAYCTFWRRRRTAWAPLQAAVATAATSGWPRSANRWPESFSDARPSGGNGGWQEGAVAAPGNR